MCPVTYCLAVRPRGHASAARLMAPCHAALRPISPCGLAVQMPVFIMIPFKPKGPRALGHAAMPASRLRPIAGGAVLRRPEACAPAPAPVHVRMRPAAAPLRGAADTSTQPGWTRTYTCNYHARAAHTCPGRRRPPARALLARGPGPRLQTHRWAARPTRKAPGKQ